MKKLLIILILLININTFGQFSVNIGFDPKIGLFGTDNKYTQHDAIANFIFKVEYIDNTSLYLAIGTEYANLKEWYIAYYGNIGFVFKSIFKLKIIPQLELGNITRELLPIDINDHRRNPNNLYIGTNLAIRYQFNNLLALETQSSLKLAPDINKTFRYEGYISLIFTIIN